MNSELKLCSRSDDIGSTHAANRAGVFAIETGVVKNVSILVPGPAFNEVPSMFSGRGGVALGLHVTLNSEWDRIKWGPVLGKDRVSNLVDERGYFLKRPEDCAERGLDLEQAVAEVEAQLELATSRGLKIEYLDEHCGIGKVGGLRAELVELAKRHGLVVVHDVPLLGIWNPSGDIADYWCRQISSAAAGTYLFLTHPCYDDEEARQMGNEVASRRDAERRALADPRVPQACRARGARLIRYTEMNQT